MTQTRTPLPQSFGPLFLTDGGLETTLLFHEGFDLPHFAAFTLLDNARGREALRRYYRRYAAIAIDHSVGFVLESATWRASADWGERLGYGSERLAQANREAIELLEEERAELETPSSPMVISGCVGPRGDGYIADRSMSVDEAAGYHGAQIRTFASTKVDLVTAVTMNNSTEAIGIVRAAQDVRLPVVISFTLETDGRLPSGQSLPEGIAEVDAETNAGPAYYMINCAHAVHFEPILADAPWARRIAGLRANASKRSHAELDAAPDLDSGDPFEFGAEHAALRVRFPWLSVMGGCCGTDHRHVEQLGRACARAA